MTCDVRDECAQIVREHLLIPEDVEIVWICEKNPTHCKRRNRLLAKKGEGENVGAQNSAHEVGLESPGAAG